MSDRSTPLLVIQVDCYLCGSFYIQKIRLWKDLEEDGQELSPRLARWIGTCSV